MVKTGLRPLEDGLVLDFNFTEGAGAVLHDLSGNRNHGAFGAGAAAPTWVAGRSGGQALSFDGDDWVSVVRDASLEPPHDLTISAWINLADIIGWKTIVNHRYGDGYCLAILDNQVYYNLRQATGYSAGYVAAGLTAGIWTCLSMVLQTDNEVSIYKNRAKIYTSSGAHGTGNIVYPADVLKIGRGPIVGDAYYKGLMDKISIHERALLAEEEALFYAQRRRM